MTMNLDNSSWWGMPGRSEGRPSLLGLIENGTLDVRTAALLWLLVERKSSIIAAAGPQMAGKTTLLSTVLDFAPPQYDIVLTKGRYEDFSFLGDADPASTYILVPEFSDHLPSYLWDERVRTLFDALDRGFSTIATMHADTPEEVISIMGGHPVYIPRELVHHVGVVVNIQMVYGRNDLMRRVSRVTLVSPGASGPSLLMLVEWNRDSFTFCETWECRRTLEAHVGMAEGELYGDMARRTEALEGWLDGGMRLPEDVRALVADYYQRS